MDSYLVSSCLLVCGIIDKIDEHNLNALPGVLYGFDHSG